MKNNNPQNYKPFYNSTIPSDWEIMKLIDCCQIKGEYGINAASVEFSEELPTYIRITDIDDDGNYSTVKKVSVNDESSNNYILRKGDILFARTGATVGKTYLYNENDGKLVFAGFLIRFRPDENVLLTKHLKYFTLTKIYWDWVKTVSMRSGQPGINAEEYGSLKLPLPPLPEQKAIAQFLSAWDKAIEIIQKLIGQKELRKKWLMQNLLSGRKRMNGDYRDWRKVKIGDAFEFVKTRSYTRENLTYYQDEGSVNYIHYGDIHTKFKAELLNASLEQRIPFLKSNFEFDINSELLWDGDVIMADASEDYEGVGESTEIFDVKDKKIIGGLHTIVLRDKLNLTIIGFRGYLFNGEQILNKLRKFSTGISVYGISKNNVAKVEILIPSIEEQAVIASILQATDKEIQILNIKLEKLKEQKKGLMQVLLIGKKRLKV